MSSQEIWDRLATHGRSSLRSALIVAALSGSASQTRAQLPGSVRSPSLPQVNATSAISRVPQQRELYCRGGASGLQFGVVANPSPRSTASNKPVAMSLHYRRSKPWPSGGSPLQYLEPGSCSWNDSSVPESGVVEFDVAANAQQLQVRQGVPVDHSVNAAWSYPDTASVPRFLTSAQNFWRFIVMDRGDNVARSHGPWHKGAVDTQTSIAGSVKTLPAGGGMGTTGSAIAAQSGTSTNGSSILNQPQGTAPKGGQTSIDLTRAPLRLKEVNTVLDKFTITFMGRPNATPSVWFSQDEPIREPSTGRWFFKGGVIQGSGAVEGGTKAEVSGGVTSALVANYVAWNRLPAEIERGRTYHYIVTMPRSVDTPEEQISGTFTTVAQNVRVVFNSIDVLYTRHEHMHFFFSAFDRDGPRGDRRELGTVSNTLDWQKGMHNLDGQTLEVQNIGDHLRVLIWGDDADRRIIAQGGNLPDVSWDTRPGTSSRGDMNIARTEINIGVSPTERVLTFPFQLRSVDGNYLMFIVTGRVEVTRR